MTDMLKDLNEIKELMLNEMVDDILKEMTSIPDFNNYSFYDKALTVLTHINRMYSHVDDDKTTIGEYSKAKAHAVLTLKCLEKLQDI